MWIHGGKRDETPMATSAEGLGEALSGAIGAIMVLTAAGMICYVVQTESFAVETTTAGKAHGPAQAAVEQWCKDAMDTLRDAQTRPDKDAIRHARVDANLICAKAAH